MQGNDTIVSRFERQARATPDQIALVHDDRRVSYRELDALADQLAARLDTVGIRADALVGLVASRSIDLVVGILAILKAGGGYLPLDPTYPRDRLAFMLDDAAPVALLVQRDHHGELPAFAGPVIVIDEPADRPGTPRSSGVRGDDLAYVIYTSGSTGRPKGVMITHAHVIRLLDATHDWFAFGATDVWTLFHSYAFDFSVWELWGALLYGGRLVIVPYLTSRSSEDFYRLVVDERVTVLNQTPSAFRQFIAADKTVGGPTEALALRYVIFGGEALDVSMLAPWFERHGDARPQLVNMFGITETTVHVTYRPLRRSDLGSPTSPIGIAIPDLVLHVLDGRLMPAPIGEPGEIYVGGAGVARGYLGRPGLTAERFVPDPTRPGARLYRSGDLGQRRADGDLEFLGRADDQIKIRGFRIEPGEIASVIAGHPGVEDAVVVPWRPDQEAARLVAYVIPRAGPVRELVRLDVSAAGRPRVELPNGMTICCLHDGLEASLQFREIFENRVYLRHGITLCDGDCVFDIGANLGMFSLFVWHRVTRARVFAYEPIPDAYDALNNNLRIYGAEVERSNHGVSDRNEYCQLTYYPHFAGMSGRYHDDDAEPARQISCRMTTLSELIRQRNVDEIHLLKISAAKSEADVLRGIEPDHWPRIHQIVAEVHDVDGRLHWTRHLLETTGFTVAIDEHGAGRYMVYAKRPAFRRTSTDDHALHLPAWTSITQLVGSLRDRARAQLPDYMQPAAFVLLDRFPLTDNGKLDRRALPTPDTVQPSPPKPDEAPATPLEEELMQLWTELLGVPISSTSANFFELGGHSLLLIQVANRIREAFGADLDLGTLFDTHTIAQLAHEITERLAGSANDNSVQGLLSRLEGLSPEEVERLLLAEGE